MPFWVKVENIWYSQTGNNNYIMLLQKRCACYAESLKQEYGHRLIIFNALCFSRVTIVRRGRLNFTPHVHRLSCLSYLTPWSRVPFEKLTGAQLVKKYPAFYGNLRLITTLSLFWARPIQSMLPSKFLKIHFSVILPSTPGPSKWSLSLRFFRQNLVRISPLPNTCYVYRPSNISLLDQPNNNWRVQVMKLLMQ